MREFKMGINKGFGKFKGVIGFSWLGELGWYLRGEFLGYVGV